MVHKSFLNLDFGGVYWPFRNLTSPNLTELYWVLLGFHEFSVALWMVQGTSQVFQEWFQSFVPEKFFRFF